MNVEQNKLSYEKSLNIVRNGQTNIITFTENKYLHCVLSLRIQTGGDNIMRNSSIRFGIIRNGVKNALNGMVVGTPSTTLTQAGYVDFSLDIKCNVKANDTLYIQTGFGGNQDIVANTLMSNIEI